MSGEVKRRPGRPRNPNRKRRTREIVEECLSLGMTSSTEIAKVALVSRQRVDQHIAAIRHGARPPVGRWPGHPGGRPIIEIPDDIPYEKLLAQEIVLLLAARGIQIEYRALKRRLIEKGRRFRGMDKRRRKKA